MPGSSLVVFSCPRLKPNDKGARRADKKRQELPLFNSPAGLFLMDDQSQQRNKDEYNVCKA